MPLDVNTLLLSDPNSNPVAFANAQRAQLIGNMLMQHGQQPDGQMVSDRYVAPSWTQRLAGMLNLVGGNKMATDASGQIATMQANAMRNLMVGGEGGAASGGATSGGVNGGSGMPDVWQDPNYRKLAMREIYGFLPQGTAAAYAKAVYESKMPTNEQKNYEAAGVPMEVWGNKDTAPMPIGRTGQVYDPKTGMTYFVPINGKQVVPLGNGQFGYQNVPGAVEAEQQSKAAEVIGSGNAYGPDGNPLPVNTPVPGVQTATAPATVRNNNPLAISDARGNIKSFADPNSAYMAGDSILAKYGTMKLSDLIAKYSGNHNADNYTAFVAKNLGITPDTVVNMADPRQRIALANEIMKWESGVTNPFTNPKPQWGVYGKPPLGAVANADASQQSYADTMKRSFNTLQASRSNAPTILEALDKMIKLASNKPSYLSGYLATNHLTTSLSPEAAEYEKQRANVIALMGSALGNSNTDAARAMLGEALPDYGKPKAAILDGLTTQRNQIAQQMLKANILTPVYQSGDSKKYTELENKYDQIVKPSMVPQLQSILAMPPGQARSNALSKLVPDQDLRNYLDQSVTGGAQAPQTTQQSTPKISQATSYLRSAVSQDDLRARVNALRQNGWTDAQIRQAYGAQ